jgi:Na+/melibiose symporter-like transporter
MLPDVLDEFMLVTGERRDAIFYSFYVFFNKLAAGLGLGLSQVALQLVANIIELMSGSN